MGITLGHITFDCADPLKMSAFWSAALERPVDDGASEFFAAIGADGATPKWFFIQVPEAKSVKNRVHVDLIADDRDAEVARLLSLGATSISQYDEWGAQWTLLNDVEGNEFCVSEAHD